MSESIDALRRILWNSGHEERTAIAERANADHAPEVSGISDRHCQRCGVPVAFDREALRPTHIAFGSLQERPGDK